jgi:glycosyltransferase involved in cell wall biosynthesis
MKPLFSLMMICYNNVQFIKMSIDSVKTQTYDNWELIIVDDRSSDGTYELAQKLAEGEPRIKVFQNAKNLMTPKNRAEASKHMTGDFMGHVDADDALYPHALDYFVKADVWGRALAFARLCLCLCTSRLDNDLEQLYPRLD